MISWPSSRDPFDRHRCTWNALAGKKRITDMDNHPSWRGEEQSLWETADENVKCPFQARGSVLHTRDCPRAIAFSVVYGRLSRIFGSNGTLTSLYIVFIIKMNLKLIHVGKIFNIFTYIFTYFSLLQQSPVVSWPWSVKQTSRNLNKDVQIHSFSGNL